MSWGNKMHFCFKKNRQHFLQQLLIVAFVLFYMRFRDGTSRSLPHTRLKNMTNVLIAQRFWLLMLVHVACTEATVSLASLFAVGWG